MGIIQTGHTELLPPQVCGKSCREFRLGVQTCPLQLVSFIDIINPSRYSFKPSCIDFLVGCIIFIVLAFIDPKTFPWLCYQIISGMYSNQTNVFASPAGLWKVVVRVPVFYFT